MSISDWFLTFGVVLTVIVIAFAYGYLHGLQKNDELLAEAYASRSAGLKDLLATREENAQLRADLNSALEEKWQRS